MVVQFIYLNNNNVSKESWQELIDYICKYNGAFRKFKIVIEISNNKIKYYLVTKYKVPLTINSIEDFLIKEDDINIEIDYLKHKPIILDVDKNAVELSDISRLKHNRELKYIIINFIPFLNKRLFKTYLFFKNGEILESAIEDKIGKKLILVVDEVSLLENPIMERILAEARKFNIALILTEQYFGQISKKLQDSIFANVINYYAFRTSRSDAVILKDILNIKFAKEVTDEDKINLLTGLNNREVIVRVSKDGKILPVVKAKTTYFEAVPLERDNVKVRDKIKEVHNNIKSNFSNFTTRKLKDILITLSNSRKKGSNRYE